MRWKSIDWWKWFTNVHTFPHVTQTWTDHHHTRDSTGAVKERLWRVHWFSALAVTAETFHDKMCECFRCNCPSWPDWTLWWTAGGPRAVCRTPVFCRCGAGDQTGGALGPEGDRVENIQRHSVGDYVLQYGRMNLRAVSTACVCVCVCTYTGCSWYPGFWLLVCCRAYGRRAGPIHYLL